MNYAKKLIAVALLTTCKVSLASEVDSISLNLSNVNTQISMSGGPGARQLGVTINGIFKVPTYDSANFSLSSVTFAFSGDLGGALWSSGSIGGNISTSVSLGGLGASPFSDVRVAQTPNNPPYPNSIATWVTYEATTVLSDAVPGTLASDYAGNTSGYSPVSVSLNANTNGGTVNSQQFDLNNLAFIHYPILQVTYTLNPLVSGMTATDLPTGDTAQFTVNTTSSLNDSSAAFPASSLPPYVVPEPASWCLVAFGGCIFLFRQRKKGDK